MLIVDTLPNHFRTAMCWELLGTVTAATTALNTPHSSDHRRTFYPQRISDLQRTSPVSTHRLSLRRSTLHSSAPMLIGSPSRSTSIRAPHSHTPLQLYQAKLPPKSHSNKSSTTSSSCPCADSSKPYTLCCPMTRACRPSMTMMTKSSICSSRTIRWSTSTPCAHTNSSSACRLRCAFMARSARAKQC